MEDTTITFCYELGGSLERVPCANMTEARGLMTEANAKGIECYIHIK